MIILAIDFPGLMEVIVSIHSLFILSVDAGVFNVALSRPEALNLLKIRGSAQNLMEENCQQAQNLGYYFSKLVKPLKQNHGPEPLLQML
jgi:hypothetical protein